MLPSSPFTHRCGPGGRRKGGGGGKGRKRNGGRFSAKALRGAGEKDKGRREKFPTFQPGRRLTVLNSRILPKETRKKKGKIGPA